MLAANWGNHKAFLYPKNVDFSAQCDTWPFFDLVVTTGTSAPRNSPDFSPDSKDVDEILGCNGLLYLSTHGCFKMSSQSYLSFGFN